MTQNTNGELMQLAMAYGKACNDADASAILALHTEDSLFQLHNGSPPALGIDAVSIALREFFAQWSGVNFVRRSIFFGKDNWTAEWTLTAKSRDEGVSRSEGKTVSFEGVDVVTARDGRVSAKHVYYDATTASKMLGIEMT
jgi:ketosteroid isomerase-like protein